MTMLMGCYVYNSQKLLAELKIILEKVSKQWDESRRW